MTCKISYSRAALRDLDRVYSEVLKASQSYDTASRYIEELLDKVQTKADFPKSGSPLYYENSFTGYYFVVFKAYIAFYRLENDAMLVDRVLYGKSDYMRLIGINTDEFR